MADVALSYQPWPKQESFHRCAANEVLYGGAAGPGKSHALRAEGLIWAMRIRKLQVYLFRRTFPELEKNHIIPSNQEFPAGIGVYKEQKRRWEFHNGSMLHFCHCQYEKDVFAYQGAEIHLLLLDELTSFTEFMYDYLRGRVRCSMPIPPEYRHKIPGIAAGTNPGGVGHEFCKRRWVNYVRPGDLKRAPSKEGGMVRAYIPGRLEDNPSLTVNDPGYIHRLDALPEPYRTAYKEGNWDLFFGQAFSFNTEWHVCKPFPIPQYAKVYMTFDWGFGAPFSVNWFWVDGDGRLYLSHEWYGWTGTPNQGIRMPDAEIAKGVKQREEWWGLKGRDITRLAGPDCFAKKPDYQGGGQGPSTAETFAAESLYLVHGDPSRTLKVRQMHQRLHKPEDGSLPMLMVYESCEQFIRTIPLLQADPHNPEDVDTTMEDHVYDSVCHVLMARPISMTVPKPRQSSSDRHIDEVTKPFNQIHPDELYLIHAERETARELGVPIEDQNADLADVWDYGETPDKYGSDLIQTGR